METIKIQIDGILDKIKDSQPQQVSIVVPERKPVEVYLDGRRHVVEGKRGEIIKALDNPI